MYVLHAYPMSQMQILHGVLGFFLGGAGKKGSLIFSVKTYKSLIVVIYPTY